MLTRRIEHLLSFADWYYNLESITYRRDDKFLFVKAMVHEPSLYCIDADGMRSNEFLDLFFGQMFTVARMIWIAIGNNDQNLI